MKKYLPTILVIACVAVIIIGVVGISNNKSDDSSGELHAKENITTSSGNYQPTADNNDANMHDISHLINLLDVNLPSNLSSQMKDYTGFTVSYNSSNKTPNYVAWELLGTETDGVSKRSNKFWTDREIDGCSENSDYSRSGYDRGHMCPAADQKWSVEAMEDCFVMANMCPQDHSLNSGAWNTLENKERTWAKRDSAILIVAGPLYTDKDQNTIGKNQVRVPGAFFKCIVAPYLDAPRGIAFIFPNMSSPGNMENYVVSIDQVEQLTGYDFFHNLPNDIENAVEAESSFREWNRRK